MSTITFDSFDFLQSLENDKVFNEEQSKSLTKAISKAFKQHKENVEINLVKKQELIEYKSLLKEDFAKIDNRFQKIEIRLQNIENEIKDVRKDLSILGDKLLIKLSIVLVTIIGLISGLMTFYFSNLLTTLIK